jgi:hypothetical protein
MKWNSTIGLTLILLAGMFVAGVVSATAGMKLGQEALKGITQPDTRPTNGVGGAAKAGGNRSDELVILPEDKIIASVKARVGGKTAPEAKATTPEAKPAGAAAKFPLSMESKNVTLEVKSMQAQGDALVLSVSLKNESDNPVKFLYSFLEVKDDQGKILNANAEGLPAEIPADGQAYSGTIRVPVISVDKSEKLAIALSDYPDQTVQLDLADIPIIR